MVGVDLSRKSPGRSGGLAPGSPEAEEDLAGGRFVEKLSLSAPDRVDRGPHHLPVEAPPRSMFLGRSSTVGIALGVDPLQQDAGRSAVAVGDHHRIDDKGGDADDPFDVAHLLHDIAVFAEVDRVLEDEHVGVHAEDLLAELLLEAARDAHHDGKRSYPERDAEHGEGGADGNEGALLRAQIAKGEIERVAHDRIDAVARTTPM